MRFVDLVKSVTYKIGFFTLPAFYTESESLELDSLCWGGLGHQLYAERDGEVRVLSGE